MWDHRIHSFRSHYFGLFIFDEFKTKANKIQDPIKHKLFDSISIRDLNACDIALVL